MTDRSGELERNGGAAALEGDVLRREAERLRDFHGEDLLRAVLTHSPHGIIVCNAAGDLILHNPAAERIWAGKANANGVNEWAQYRAFHPDGRPYAPSDWSMARCLSEGKVTEAGETHFQRFDDTHGILLGSAAPIYAKDGSIVGALSVFVDVTTERHAEAALLAEREARRQEEARAHAELELERANLKRLFMQAPAAIAIWRGPEHVFELVNPRYEALVGRGGLVGKPLRTALPELATQGFPDILDEVYKTGIPFFSSEMRANLAPSGSESREGYFSFNVEPTRDAGGDITGLMCLAMEVTEQTLARREAEKLAANLAEERVKLALSELRFRRLAEAGGQIVWTSGAEGIPIEDSPSLRAFTGLAKEDWLGGNGWMVVHPEDRDGLHDAWVRALAERSIFTQEYRLRRADGAYVHVAARGVPILHDNGSVREWVGTTVDVSARHAAEEERSALLARERAARADAERAQRSLSTTLVSIGDAVISTDAEGRVAFMNPVAEALTGWPSDEARGKELRSVFRIVNEHTRKEVESPADRVLRDGVVVGLANHTVLIGRTGSEAAIDDSGAPLRDQDGRLTGVVLVFRDVTAKKRAEDRREFLAEASLALASSLDVRKTLSHVTRLAVPRLADWCAIDLLDEHAVASRQLAVAHVDPAKVRYAEELGKLYPPDPKALTGVPNVLRTGRPELYPTISDDLLVASAIDAEHLRILRELRLRSVMVVPLLARGRTLGAMTFVYAESERAYAPADLEFAEELARRAALAVDNARLYESAENARAMAELSNRAKDDFLATVSHELRTPLNAMLGWTRLLRTGDLNEEKKSRALETIERNAVTQAQLIEDLLDVSRIISGKFRLDVQSVELTDIAQQAIDALRLASEAKGIRMVTSLDSHAGPIMGDPNRLQQVVWNLLSNAIKFTPKGGVIRVVLERVASSLRLTVADNGQGIPASFLPHVFERFKQADGGITRHHGGLGLGLAISRQIIELHGGSVAAQSKGEGLGATFIVTLPVSPVREDRTTPSRLASVAEGAAFECPVELSGLRVLVVDDEEDARDLLAAVLEKCGSHVTRASSAATALAAIEREVPDILISDIGMPGEDGYELIRKVRALPHDKGGSIPAAALTAYARAEDRRKALNAGYMMHVPKPVEPAELVAVIANLVRFLGSGRAH